MQKTKNGFTIVELLIVIVVIGILAAITIVAYNGIQNRAKVTGQAQNMERLVRAIQLYKADGGNMNDGVGATGNWYGAVNTIYNGTTKTIHQTLIDSGHLPANFTPTNYMLALCTSLADQRRVVLAKFDPAPTNTPQEQTASDNCTAATFATYTDPAQQYKMNWAKVVN